MPEKEELAISKIAHIMASGKSSPVYWRNIQGRGGWLCKLHYVSVIQVAQCMYEYVA